MSVAAKTYLYRGEMLTIQQIARLAGISANAIRERMHKGWTIDQAADLPRGSMAKSHGRMRAERPDNPVEGMTPEEADRWRAAENICRRIASGDLRAFNFRCIAPMTEYAFEGDQLGWRIRFSPNGETARLTARYLKHGFDSDFCRTYMVYGDKIKEAQTI